MSKRYGRNAKRKAQAEIQQLKIDNSRLKRELEWARCREEDALTNSFRKFIDNQGLYVKMLDTAAHELSRSLAVELNKNIGKLLTFLRPDGGFFDFKIYGAEPITATKVLQTSIELKSLHFNQLLPK